MQLPILRDQLKTYFNESEFRDLCQDLGINYQAISGETINDHSRELVEYCRRHGLVITLIKRCQQLRPHVEWRNRKTLNSLIKSDTINTSTSTLMEALAYEISSNMISIQEFADMGYRVTESKIVSSENSNASMNYFTCMIHVFESQETQRLLTVAEPNLRERIFNLYRSFREINDKADALKQVFRPWRAEHYLNTVNKFRNELWMDGAQVVEKLSATH